MPREIFNNKKYTMYHPSGHAKPFEFELFIQKLLKPIKSRSENPTSSTILVIPPTESNPTYSLQHLTFEDEFVTMSQIVLSKDPKSPPTLGEKITLPRSELKIPDGTIILTDSTSLSKSDET